MNDYFQVIKVSPLFASMSEKEIETMLLCLDASIKECAKNQILLRVGESTDALCIVLAGSVHIVKEDFWGNQNLIAKVTQGQLFAETYACSEGATLGVSAVAAQPSAILFLKVRRVLATCGSACEFHARLIQNLLAVLASKNLMLNEKLTHVTQRTTKEKLLSYLSEQAQKNGGRTFEIPFNRQQLADYLSVDRSAMSNELCKMRDAGMLTFSGRRFTLQ